jgi:hypothetical protein
MPDLEVATEGVPRRVFTLLHEARPVLLSRRDRLVALRLPWPGAVRARAAGLDGDAEVTREPCGRGRARLHYPRMIRLALALATLVWAGCSAPTPARELRRLSYHELYEVEHIVELPDGYALLGRHGLAAYDHDDATRWTLEPLGSPLELAVLAGNELLVAASDGAGIRLDRVGLDGTFRSSVLVSDPMGPLDRPRAALRPNGGAWIFGGEWPQLWFGSVGPDGTAAIAWSAREARQDLVVAESGGAYALRSSWTNDTRSDLTLELQHLAEDGTPRWSTIVYEPSMSERFELGGALHLDGYGGVYVSTIRYDASGEELLVRRYDAAGASSSTTSEPAAPGGAGNTVVRPEGGVLWLDLVDHSAIRVRLTDASGEIAEEAVFEGDGTPIMDAIFIDGVLHVLTHDGLTRIAVP